jgi:hypothetical protein
LPHTTGAVQDRRDIQRGQLGFPYRQIVKAGTRGGETRDPADRFSEPPPGPHPGSERNRSHIRVRVASSTAATNRAENWSPSAATRTMSACKRQRVE